MTLSGPERRRRIETIFQEALDAGPEKRESVLAAHCGRDRGLRREIETLLGHYDAVQQSPPVAPGAFAGGAGPFGADPEGRPDPAGTGSVEGRRIGPYRLIREVGQGGMGRVFLAEREDLPRRVALKLALEPLASPERTKRFLFEQWVLAGLEHPVIARLYDAGVTGEGTPYFAMEYVEGEPLDVYCDRRRLSVQPRIRLLLEVLEAVQYSHARLVIHRDLKPSNILVTGEGQPKLLDFGIAKLLHEDFDHGLTRSGVLAFSPAYAAPEQFLGGTVTPATDVYQLGAILHELLSGTTPFETKGLSLPELGRLAVERIPRPVSTCVTGSAAVNRNTTVDRLRRRLRGDLDHIVAKALEKDPEDRYPSVMDLAGDLRRHLSNLPVQARAVPPLERARKFVLRHKLGAGIAAGLLVYAATATLGLVRIAEERDRARREAATATRVSDFLIGVFAAADPSDTSKVTTPVDLVDRGAARAEEDLAHEPAVLASMQEVLGRVYHYLGMDEKAGELLRSSLDTRLRLFSPRAVEVGSVKHHLAQVLWATGDLAAADSLARDALEIRRRAYGERSEPYWDTLGDLATIRQAMGDLEGAERILRELVGEVRAVHPEGHLGLGMWLNNLANVYVDLGRREEAEAMMRMALESDRQVLPEPHPSIALRLSNLAAMAAHADRYPESLDLARQALADYEAIYEGPHPDIPYALVGIGNAARGLGEKALADSAHEAALAMREDLFPPDHIGRITAYRAYGEHLIRSGRPGEAFPYLEKWRELAAGIHGEESYWFALALWNLGLAHEDLGRLDPAESCFQRGLSIHRRVLGEEHPRVGDERAHLAGFLRGRGKTGEARTLETAAPPRD